jgi:hypothetical protein
MVGMLIDDIHEYQICVNLISEIKIRKLHIEVSYPIMT